MAAAERTLYLTPLSHIYTELCYPTYYPHLNSNLLKALRYHVPHLQSPGQPFSGPSQESRSAVKAGKATFPRSTLALDVDSSLVEVVLAISDALELDEFEALWLYHAFMAYADDVELPLEAGSASIRALLVERITLWYLAEVKAIPQLAAAVIRAALDESHYYHLDAREVLGEVFDGKPEAYLKRLFGDFVAVGQRPVTADNNHWLNNLQIQSEILSVLFLCIYQDVCEPTPAAVSEGLLRGIISSGFGSQLVVHDVSAEGTRWRRKIRDQLILIAVDCLGLARVLDGEREPDTTLAYSRDTIYSLDTFLESQPSNGPLVIVRLAWAGLLRQLPAHNSPPAEDVPRFQQIATSVLKPSVNVFGELLSLVEGPLLCHSTDIEDDAELDGGLLRDTVKVLIMSTAELVNVEYLQDFAGYCEVWRAVFGKGTPEISELLCTAFWDVDYHVEGRRAVLDNSRYPANLTLLDLLQSLCSPSCAEDAFTYLAELSVVTLDMQSVAGLDHSIDSDGATVYTLTRPMRLPGGALLPAGSVGVLLSKPGQHPRTLQFNVPGLRYGWSILMEVLRTVAGGSRTIADDPFGEQQLSLSDIGLASIVAARGLDIITSSLELIQGVLLNPALANSLLYELSPGAGDDHELFRILFGLLHQPADIVLGQGPQAVRLVATALGIIQALSQPLPGVVMVSLRNAGFFTSTKTPGSASAYLRHEIRQGSYELSIAVLGLVDALVTQAAKLAFSVHANAMAELVLAAVRFVHVEVWSRYAGWKYLDIRQRFTIAQTSAKIFTRVMTEPVFVNPLGLVSAYLADVFVVAANPVTVLPIATAISSLQSLQQRLLNGKRVQDARSAKSSVVAVLALAQALLKYKMRAAPQRSTLLEATFFDNAAAADRQRLRGKVELVEIITELAVDEVQALSLLQTLVQSIAAASRKPSLVGHFRDPAVAAKRIVGLCDDPEIASVAWQTLAAIVSTQPGFAVLCVSGHRNHLDRSKQEPDNGALAVAVTCVSDWESIWGEPRLLTAVLSFCTAVWTSMPEAANTDEKFWTSVIAIATAPLTPPHIAAVHQASPDATEFYSYRTQAKARATLLLSLGEKNRLSHLFRTKSLLQPAISAAIASSCNPELHANAPTTVNLELMRTLTERRFGPGYLYDIRAIDAVLSLPDEEREEYILRVQALNLSWSTIDAEIGLVKAWRRLCEVAIPRNDQLAAKASFDVACAVAQEIARESRRGEVMQAFQAERLAVLKVLLENSSTTEDIQPLLPALRSIIDSDNYSALASVRGQLTPPIHLSIFQITYLTLRRLTAEATSFLHAALDLAASASSDLLAYDDSESLELAFAVLGQLIRPELKLAPSVWLEKITEYNLLPRSMDLVTSAQVANETYPASLRHVLNLHFAFASSPAAERLATSGLMSAYSNNAIASLAEDGAIPTMSLLYAGARHPSHKIWCSILLVVNATMSSMTSSTLYHFVRAEVIPFIELCGGQISRALEWEQTLSTPALLELEQVSVLFYSVSAALEDHAEGVLATYAQKAVILLGSIQDALAHPNHLSAMLEASSQDERTRIEQERDDEVDLLEGTMLPAMVQALLRISSTILSTLVVWTKSYELMGDKLESWPHHLILQPSDSSAASDPVGIITDLATTAIDLHRKLEGKAEPAAVSLAIPAFSPKQSLTYTRRLLEATAVLSGSQIVMRTALSGTNDDADDTGKRRATGPQDRTAQVLRELTSDLLSFLPRAETVLDRSDVVKAVGVFVQRNLGDRAD